MRLQLRGAGAHVLSYAASGSSLIQREMSMNSLRLKLSGALAMWLAFVGAAPVMRAELKSLELAATSFDSKLRNSAVFKGCRKRLAMCKRTLALMLGH